MNQALADNIIPDQTEQKRVVNSIAMIMILVSLSMLFATLFLGYSVYRVSADQWPPFGFESISLMIPGISTLVVVLSSISFVVYKKLWIQKSSSAKIFYFITLGLGLAFMASQFRLWANLKTTGIFVDSSVFASMIYAFTWIHAAHMVAGILGLLWLATSLKSDEPKELSKMINIEKFWHFLGIIWVLIFFGIFVF